MRCPPPLAAFHFARASDRHLGYDFHPVMMVLDTAPLEAERMTGTALAEAQALASQLGVEFRYLSPVAEIVNLIADMRAATAS